MGDTSTTINGADTAWMLISTVLVMLMTMPGIMPVSYTHLTLPTNREV